MSNTKYGQPGRYSAVLPSVNDGDGTALATDDKARLLLGASTQTIGAVTISGATTPTQTSVAASASSVSILIANSSRKGATITNDSSAVLYLKLGTTASVTSYTVTIAGAGSAPFAYYEVPFGYVGAIDGIWSSSTGNARITELT